MRASAGAALLAVALSCASGPVRARREPGEALALARARMVERGIALDPASRRPDRFRTLFFCYQPPGAEDRRWDRSFAVPAPGLLPLTHEGTLEEQDAFRERCPYLFRVEVTASPHPDGGSRLTATSEWWRLESDGCAPVGDPLLGRVRCDYRYVGARAPDDVESFVNGMFAGL